MSKESDQTSIQAEPIQAESVQTELPKHVWRSSELLQRDYAVLDTGHQKLNNLLAVGGWPLGTTTELGVQKPGIGELRLLLPALKSAIQANAAMRVVWIAPPFIPFAPALSKYELDIECLTVVRTTTVKDALWAAEQALQSGCCAAVFTWIDQHNLTQRESRRLQLAAASTNSWHVLLRHHDYLQQASVSGLRLTLRCDKHSQLLVHVLKQPQGWGGGECCLSLPPFYEHWQRLPVELWPNGQLVKRVGDQRQPHLRVLAKAGLSSSLKRAASNGERNRPHDRESANDVPSNVVRLKQVS